MNLPDKKTLKKMRKRYAPTDNKLFDVYLEGFLQAEGVPYAVAKSIKHDKIVRH